MLLLITQIVPVALGRYADVTRLGPYSSMGRRAPPQYHTVRAGTCVASDCMRAIVADLGHCRFVCDVSMLAISAVLVHCRTVCVVRLQFDICVLC